MSINTQSQSPLDEPAVADFITRLVRSGETNKSIARQVTRGFGIETTDDSIRRFRKRHSLHIPGTEPVYTHIKGDEAEASCRPTTEAETDPDRMLRERGLDPEEWYVDDIGVNEWDAPVAGMKNKVKMYQTKFRAKKKRPYQGLMPIRPVGDFRRDFKPYKAPQDEPELVVICGDQQAPFHDKRLHALFLQWLDYNRPGRGVVLGDLGDFPDISRHPKDPENLALAQECLQTGGDILGEYVQASEDTYWDYLIGNHDERIRAYLIANAPGVYDLHTINLLDSEGESVHNLRHLMRLDEIGVNLIEPHGTYQHAQVELSRNLAVRHGWIAQQGSGKSALVTLNQTGYSVIMGHTHRQSMVFKSQPEIDGVMRTTLAVEAGCMCRIDARDEFDEKGRRFPNYGAGHPDWQQGFCTATIWPDGKFKVDLASYVNGVLLYKEQRYQ